MRFTKPFWPGIADGSITVAFRMWRRPTVVAGRVYRTGGGRISVDSVEPWAIEAISAADARKAGYSNQAELASFLVRSAEGADGDDRRLFRVAFRPCLDPDPREVLANSRHLDAGDIDQISQRLIRLDNASSHGPWTHDTLRLIADNEAVRAPDLATSVGRETKPFKLDVRKLKNLGLTLSLPKGYRLSPRGRAYLAAVDALDVPGTRTRDAATIDHKEDRTDDES